MRYKNLARLLTKSLSTSLCAALLVASVGPQTTSAVAQVVNGVRVQNGARTGGITSVPRLGSPLNAPAFALGAGFSPALRSIIPHAVGVSVEKTIAAAGDISISQVPSLIAAPIEKGPLDRRPSEAVSAESKLSPRRTLETGVQKIGEARGLSGKFESIKAFFTGSRQGTNLPAVTAAPLGPDTSLSGLSSGKGGENRRSSAGSEVSLQTLEAAAVDPTKDPAGRQEAVRAVIEVARVRGEGVKPVLERIAQSNPEGAAADYEVHRAALRGLAEVYDDLRSLRRISDTHAAGILAGLRDNKPAMVISDYDDTLKGFREPLDEQDGARIQAVAEAGVQPVILTDRPSVAKREGDVGVLESVSALTPAQKAGLTVISDKSLNSTTFDPETGEPYTTAAEAVVWTAEERAALEAAKDVILERVETVDFNDKGPFSLYDSGLAIFLKLRMPAEEVEAAANLLKAELAKRGVTEYNVVGRTPAKDPHKNPPYLSVTKIDKSVGVRRILAERGISGKDVVIMGDQFMTQGAGRATDEFMLQGAPNARAFAVGPTADPRLDGVFLWNSEGPAASKEILEALAGEAPGEMNKKAVFGLFAQRTVSIAAFILTTIAFPFLAVPVVGWTGYGILMSFGPLAGIATGPLNGLIADRLSARNGMALNTVIRVITSLALPVLAAFGYLNFATLLIASVANGWLLSSIMTTENSYIKRLAGAKNVFTISNLAWMNYLVIQVVLGLLLGIGSIVDTWNPMVAFTINAAVNAFVVLPIIWFTMPKLSPQPKTLVEIEARIAAVRKALTKAQGDKKEKLQAEEAQLLAGIPQREAMLQGDIKKNLDAMNEASKELAALKESRPKGIRARIARFSQGKALQADIGLREKAVRTAQADLDRVILTKKDKLLSIAKFLKNNRLSEALFAGAIALYFVTNTTLPIIGALLYWITTTDGFKVLWYGKGSDVSAREADLNEKIAEAKKNGAEVKTSWTKELKTWANRLPRALILLSVLALMMYPLQYLALPKIALLLAGATGKALLTGQLLGALFFGNLIPNAAQAKLPEIKIPFIGRVPVQRLIQGLVVGLGMAWVYTGLFPGSVLATLAAAPVIAGLMALAGKLTKRAWVKFVGVGFSAIWIPYLVWGTGLIGFISPVTAMMLAVLGIGMAFGPAYTSLMGYFFSNAARDKSGAMGGVQGSFFNAAVSGGYGLLALVTSMMNPAFPAVLGGMGVLFILLGLMFLKGSNGLPGLSKTLLEPKEDK